MSAVTIFSVAVTHEQDVVAARQRARQIGALLGFEAQDQTRIATAVSEIARNAFRYGGGGRVAFAVEGRVAPQVLSICVADHGPGIDDLGDILSGRFRSSTGMGIGIAGARRLMDRFHVESAPGMGTTVWLQKILPHGAPFVTDKRLASIASALGEQRPQSPLEEMQLQNRELLRALDELRARQDELSRLNGELEDTNRGVVALYAELDEKADHLRRADEMKTRFLSNMSHEFRTPLNSIRALSRLLLDRTDGNLTGEQETQVRFIRKAAEDLTDLVNDLLDLAKVEAGKIVVRPIEFHVANLFGALRGMLRPLLVNESVTLVFEDPSAAPSLYTDEAKVSQILRNFISNALKFTERGEIRVAARSAADGAAVEFSVTDTGIGIAPEDQERIFKEFGQLEHPLQRKVLGTGLGLPLTRKLTELLGGRVGLVSRPGVGSTFSATIPSRYVEPGAAASGAGGWRARAERPAVLVVEDSPEDALLYETFLKDSGFGLIRVVSTWQARQVLRGVRPAAIVLDILLRGEDAWGFLAELKRAEATRDIPVVVVSAVDDQHKGLGLGADTYAVKPVERQWLLDTLAEVTRPAPGTAVLVIDDDPAARYLVRSVLAGGPYAVTEAADGVSGLERARRDLPAAIVLDLVMPGMTGFEVLDRLKDTPATRAIPVIVLTSRTGPGDESLHGRAAAVLSKEATSPETVRAAVDSVCRREAVE
jgi:signal transduction histidine kinase/DNA-binding response OmpR family regulator